MEVKVKLKFNWTKERINILKNDYFPGLDPAMLVWKIFGSKRIPSNSQSLREVNNKLHLLGLRPKKGYDI